MAAPALADEVGVRAGPVGAGVTVGGTLERDRTTVIKEREPESKTVIKKEDSDGNRKKTVIKKYRDHVNPSEKAPTEIGLFLTGALLRYGGSNWRDAARATWS
jgi:hypothetical protein